MKPLLQDVLEKKIDYCEHLLGIAQSLCPGPSEMRGYLLWESHGAKYRLIQWKWIRMRISTAQYLSKLQDLAQDLKEVISILGPIRMDSDEGQMGLKAKDELRSIENLIKELSRQSANVSTLSGGNNALDLDNKNKTISTLSRAQRRSICL